jgi:hypothetical protein
MNRKFKAVVMFVLFTAFICGTFTESASARRRDDYWHPPRGYVSLELRGARFFYHHGLFFRRINSGLVIVAPPIGVVVPFLPIGYVTLRFGGWDYYYMDGVYYRPCPSGYLTVPESEVENLKQKANMKTEELARDATGYYTVNIPNSDGTFIAVKLRKSGAGYIGPQGEYYGEHPTVEQLKVLYGK